MADIWRSGWRDGHLGHVPDELVAARTDRSFDVRAARRVADTTVAVVGDQVAGFVMVVRDEVEQVYVDDRHRGTGVASILLAEAERLIAAVVYDAAWLAVVAGNSRARRFYERCGWRDARSFDHQAPSDAGPITVPARRNVKGVVSGDSPDSGRAPRLAATPEDFAAAAQLQIDFNTQSDDPAPPADELARHLARLCGQGDTRVWLIGDPPLGHAIVRVRTQSLVDELKGYLAKFYVRPDRRGLGSAACCCRRSSMTCRRWGDVHGPRHGRGRRLGPRDYEKLGFDCHEGRDSGPLGLYYEKDL